MHFKFKRNKIKCSKYWSKLFLYLETLGFVFPLFVISLKISTLFMIHTCSSALSRRVFSWNYQMVTHTGTCWDNDKMDRDTSQAQRRFKPKSIWSLTFFRRLCWWWHRQEHLPPPSPRMTWHMKVTKKAAAGDVLSEVKQKMRWGRCWDVSQDLLSIYWCRSWHNTQHTTVDVTNIITPYPAIHTCSMCHPLSSPLSLIAGPVTTASSWCLLDFWDETQ